MLPGPEVSCLKACLRPWHALQNCRRSSKAWLKLPVSLFRKLKLFRKKRPSRAQS